MTRLSLFVILATIPFGSFSQSQKILWKKEFASEYPFHVASILETKQVSDGIIFILMRSGLTGAFKPEKPLVNPDTTFRHWVIKYSNDGVLQWKYLMDYCHGGIADPTFYTIEVFQNNIFIWGNITSPSGRCKSPGKYILVSLDKNGNERFLRTIPYKPEFVGLRSKDILLAQFVYPHVVVRRIDHMGKILADSGTVERKSYYAMAVNDRDEVFMFEDGRVTKLNPDLTLKTKYEFSPDYTSREYGHPDDFTKVRMIGRDKLVAYYTSERLLTDQDSLGRYNEQAYIMYVDISKKAFWFTDVGEIADDDLVLDAWGAHGNVYLSYLGYKNPANLKQRKVFASMVAFSETGKVLWKKSFPTTAFFGSLRVIPSPESLTCFYVTPSADYHKDDNELMTFDDLSPQGVTLSHGNIDVDNTSYKHIKSIYKIAERDYLIVLSFNYRAAVLRVKVDW